MNEETTRAKADLEASVRDLETTTGALDQEMDANVGFGEWFCGRPELRRRTKAVEDATAAVTRNTEALNRAMGGQS